MIEGQTVVHILELVSAQNYRIMAVSLDMPRRLTVPGQVASYQLDDSTVVLFEVEQTGSFQPAAPGMLSGKVREAVAPAVEAAREVLDKVKELRPDEVEVAFGIKVSGGAHWLVAKAVGEANFEITLRWSSPSEPQVVESTAAPVAENENSVKGAEHERNQSG